MKSVSRKEKKNDLSGVGFEPTPTLVCGLEHSGNPDVVLATQARTTRHRGPLSYSSS